MSLLKFLQPGPLDPILQVVSGVPLFRDCTRAELEILRLHLHEREFLAGEIVFDEGEEGEGVYIVIRGKLKATRHGMIKEKQLGWIHAGESFGEMALLGASPRNATVTAEENTMVLAMFRPELLQLSEARPRLGYKIALGIAAVLAMRLGRKSEGESPEAVAS